MLYNGQPGKATNGYFPDSFPKMCQDFELDY